MKFVSILVCLFSAVGLGIPVVPLGTTPEGRTYLGFVPGLLARAEREIVAALSDLRLYGGDGATGDLVAALVSAAGRGVRVRVLVELRREGPLPEQEAAVRYLEERGVGVKWDSPDVTLHAKFLVVDRRWVVVGSTHWTASALTRSVQADLAIESRELGAAFGAFFDLLWEGKLKVNPRLPPEPWPRPTIVPLLEFPGSGLHAALIPALLRGAKASVDLLVYRLAYYPAYADSPANRVVDELCRAAARGVRVRVLLEGGEEFPDLGGDNRIAAAYLAACGVEVRLDPPGTTLHGKVLLVDGQDVVVTSANVSYASLVQNVEAGVALLGARELGFLLRGWFDLRWGEGRPLR
ncbi:MAG: phospholipase D-like domain-containing protein [Candidatus Bipolaricaulota bacterium]|nr:phospholipase D-like domain-containing protein [Candidatus Bipolaricaulota bacterium]